MPIAAQRSFDQLGTPLTDVVFCVIDLETTGGSNMDAITEVGAVKVQRGEIIGTFQTLVDPGQPVPAFIRLLTGIDDAMLTDAPPVSAVLPPLLDFIGDSVVVAHNARFDVTFINNALRAHDRPQLSNKVLDTAILARKILSGEVPNNKLATLASHLRCAHRPNHRAFTDVLATVDVLHHLIERVAGYGVTTLEDLIAISATKMDGTFSKIRLAEDLPKRCGVYRFIGNDKTLYVGKATDIRSRVRSYFYGDPRRRIKDLLRETDRIEATVYPTLFEAEVAEARAILEESPPYNRSGKRTKQWYVRVTMGAKPKIGAARVAKDDGNLYVGPFRSMATVRTLLDGLRDAARVHRCTDPRRCGDCPYADMGSCAGPDEQKTEIRRIASAIAGDPRPCLERVAARMKQLARAERFEEADEVRRRGSLLETTLRTAAEAHALNAADRIVLAIEDRAILLRGCTVAAATDIRDGDERGAVTRLLAYAAGGKTPASNYLTPRQYAEVRVISSWLRRSPGPTRVLYSARPWSIPATCGPGGLFEAKDSARARKGPQHEAAALRDRRF